jgi:hypothetical protein
MVYAPNLMTEGIKEMPIGKSDKIIFGIKKHKKYTSGRNILTNLGAYDKFN